MWIKDLAIKGNMMKTFRRNCEQKRNCEYKSQDIEGLSKHDQRERRISVLKLQKAKHKQ